LYAAGRTEPGESIVKQAVAAAAAATAAAS